MTDALLANGTRLADGATSSDDKPEKRAACEVSQPSGQDVEAGSSFDTSVELADRQAGGSISRESRLAGVEPLATAEDASPLT